MHAILPLLQSMDFPALRRGALGTLQVNLGYLCNQSCLHCHVNAGPGRKEIMSRENIDVVLEFLQASGAHTLDLTGGAPELNPHFPDLVRQARLQGVGIIDRCNLTILEEPGQEGLATFLAEYGVRISASMPCYLEENVDKQRGAGVYESSIRGLLRLNRLGYGIKGTGLELNLVYNPQGPHLPPPQNQLEQDYKRELRQMHGIEFNQLLTITNMPIQRFGSTLVSKGQFHDYMALLKDSHLDRNLAAVMCRNLISVDWQGYVYDCDFNQMLGMPLKTGNKKKSHLRDIMTTDLGGLKIAVADHCFGCTAGQGSGCGGAFEG